MARSANLINISGGMARIDPAVNRHFKDENEVGISSPGKCGVTLGEKSVFISWWRRYAEIVACHFEKLATARITPCRRSSAATDGHLGGVMIALAWPRRRERRASSRPYSLRPS